jgi:hypothetical protein
LTIGGGRIRRSLKWALATTIGLAMIAAAVQADDEAKRESILGRAESVLDNDYYKISIDMRQRFDFAKQNMLDRSEGITLRTRLGIGTKPIAGFSGFAELGNVFSYCRSCYFDTVEPPNGKTPIADPRDTDLNRLFLQYENDGDMPLTAIVGRQRIIFDDARFVGNVTWRQHEQT